MSLKKIRKDFLPLGKPHITEDEINAISEVVKSGWWTTGPKVNEFETLLSKYLTHDKDIHCLALNSCTSALYLSLLALDIKPDDEVILPTWTFVATSHIVEWLGAKPVLCDIDESTFNIDVNQIKNKLTKKTKAIIPVHIAGYPCQMDEIMHIADNNNLFVIEDAAHAIGTKYKGKKIGNIGDLTCFSFYATKNLAMGEGGAVVSRNPELIEKMRKLSYFGIDKSAFKRYNKTGSWFYDIEQLGYKCNLDSIHASLGIVQLKKLDDMNNRRRDIAQRYANNLSKKLQFQKNSSEHFHTYHLFPIILPVDVIRNDFIDMLKERNIGGSVHFIPLHLHSYFSRRFDKNEFPVANMQFERTLSIPMFPSMTDEDVDYVIEHINDILG